MNQTEDLNTAGHRQVVAWLARHAETPHTQFSRVEDGRMADWDQAIRIDQWRSSDEIREILQAASDGRLRRADWGTALLIPGGAHTNEPGRFIKADVMVPLTDGQIALLARIPDSNLFILTDLGIQTLKAAKK